MGLNLIPFIVVKTACAVFVYLGQLHHRRPCLRLRRRQSEPSCPSFSLSVFESGFASGLESLRRLLRKMLVSLRVRLPLLLLRH